jgi:2-isopropylmalate synthase
MRSEFGAVVQTISERTGKEVSPGMIWDAFEDEYLRADKPFSLKGCRVNEMPCEDAAGQSPGVEVSAAVIISGSERTIAGKGNGPIDAFSDALKSGAGENFRLLSYHEHALEKGSHSKAAAYIQIEDDSGKTFFGVGIDTNIDIAAFKAILSALNRSRRYR